MTSAGKLDGDDNQRPSKVRKVVGDRMDSFACGELLDDVDDDRLLKMWRKMNFGGKM